MSADRRHGEGNDVRLSAAVAAREALRYTPAGIPVLSLTLEHKSSQIEANVPRLVELTMEAVAIGELAHRMDRLQAGDAITVRGFLAKRSRRSRRAVLHVSEFESH